MLTPRQALLICEAHDIEGLLTDLEETIQLERHNPELLEAYRALYRRIHDTVPKGSHPPHRFRENPKFPSFCRLCGYPPDEPLMHIKEVT